MIKETEVLNVLGEEIPHMNPELEKLAGTGNVYKCIQCFADFTKELLITGNLKAAKTCFRVAEKMMEEGNTAVRNAMENVFVFSVTVMVDVSSPFNAAIKSLMKGPVLKEYRRQTHMKGI
jgi:hypothetical protein